MTTSCSQVLNTAIVQPYAVWFKNKYLMAVLAVVIISALAILLPSLAHADLPTAVTAAFSGLQSNFDALMALAWPVIAAVATGLWLVGLFVRIIFKI